jgi:uncharacterized protein (DUF58 family)
MHRGDGHLVATPDLKIPPGRTRALDARCLERLIETPPFSGAYGWEP